MYQPALQAGSSVIFKYRRYSIFEHKAPLTFIRA
nr:MAG TPA: hypothetical protein [Caudoviricetes sp.]